MRKEELKRSKEEKRELKELYHLEDCRGGRRICKASVREDTFQLRLSVPLDHVTVSPPLAFLFWEAAGEGAEE